MTEHTAHLLPSMIHTGDHARALMEEFKNLLSEVIRK